MIEVYVDHIENYENGSKMGVATWDDTIAENMPIIYDKELQRGIQHYIKNPPDPDGFYIFSKFCQFIVLFKWSTSIGASISLSDHNNNLDNALDEYLELTEKEWSLDDRNTIMKIFEEIRNDESGERAIMVLREKRI